MNVQDNIVAVTALLMLGLIWLRTRIQYSRTAERTLQLRKAGWMYFGAAAAVLVTGWFAAPALGRMLWPATGATPTLMRVIWCLATYYIFIIVHRVLKSRGIAVFH